MSEKSDLLQADGEADSVTSPAGINDAIEDAVVNFKDKYGWLPNPNNSTIEVTLFENHVSATIFELSRA